MIGLGPRPRLTLSGALPVWLPLQVHGSTVSEAGVGGRSLSRFCWLVGYETIFRSPFLLLVGTTTNELQTASWTWQENTAIIEIFLIQCQAALSVTQHPNNISNSAMDSLLHAFDTRKGRSPIIPSPVIPCAQYLKRVPSVDPLHGG